MGGFENNIHQREADPRQNLFDGSVGIVVDRELFGLLALVLADQRGEQGVLGREIGIDRALRDAGHAGDIVHRGGVEAVREEDISRPVQNLSRLGAVERARVRPALPRKVDLGLFQPAIVTTIEIHNCRLNGSVSLEIGSGRMLSQA